MLALALCTFGAPTSGGAQQPKKGPRVAVLHPGAPTTSGHLATALTQRLQDFGYIENQNIFIERRFGDARPERLPELAAEIVRLKPDVIVTSADAAIAAVRAQTRTIPIVMANSTDPVSTGFVASLARPGGNVTGLTGLSPELSGKRLELLREVVPGLTRVAILWDPEPRGAVFDYKETESAARTLRLQLHSAEVSRASDLDRTFAALATARAEALSVATVPLFFTSRSEIATRALKHRLPSVSGLREYAEAGGLIAYGPSIADGWRRAAGYVDKILKGAKPGDLPVQQPTRFELVLNLKTAKALGVTIPPALRQRADDVIE